MLDTFIEVLWIVASFMIFFCGIYFSFKLCFVHLNFKKMFIVLFEKNGKGDSISSFESLTMSLAGRIGVGSLSGVALAVYIGGPGILFWIWLTSFVGASTTFAESVLAVAFRNRDTFNSYQGGPYYYIRDGLGKNGLAFIYALVILIAYIGGFSTMQVNTISKSVESIINISPLFIGIIVAIMAGITIFGGIKKIAEVTSRLVPLMTVFYVSVCLYIIGNNIEIVPQVLRDVFNSAFNFKSFGLGILSTLLIGMQKGIFSSEVGLGTGSIVAGATETSNPNNNGLVQTLGIHIENILFATITVFVICMSPYKYVFINDPNGIELTLHAFRYHIGDIGSLFIVITIILFGISTIIAGYYYGESSLKFLKKTNNFDLCLLKIITILILVIGSIVSSDLLWTVVDILVGVIAIVNIYALFRLRNVVAYIYEKI